MTSGTGMRAVVMFSALLVSSCSSGLLQETAQPATTDEPAEVSTTTDTLEPIAGSTVRPDGPFLDITVTRVSDGDSVRASSAEGDLEIRLIGLNTPEGDECLGDVAKTELERLLAAGSVRLTPWPAELDDFGRELGFLVTDDSFVNLAMIEAGLAVARSQSGHEFANDFEAAETQASDADLGIWAPDACGEATGNTLAIIGIQANAPGDDRENPNGEWVTIINEGAEPAPMLGWVLRDESTRHRYDFADVTIPPGREARIFTGCGDNDLASDPIKLYWCDPEPPVWNNGGDTAFLLDPNGGTMDFVRYES